MILYRKAYLKILRIYTKMNYKGKAWKAIIYKFFEEGIL